MEFMPNAFEYQNKGCQKKLAHGKVHITTRIPRMEFMPTALINQNNKLF